MGTCSKGVEVGPCQTQKAKKRWDLVRGPMSSVVASLMGSSGCRVSLKNGNQLFTGGTFTNILDEMPLHNKQEVGEIQHTLGWKWFGARS